MGIPGSRLTTNDEGRGHARLYVAGEPRVGVRAVLLLVVRHGLGCSRKLSKAFDPPCPVASPEEWTSASDAVAGDYIEQGRRSTKTDMHRMRCMFGAKTKAFLRQKTTVMAMRITNTYSMQYSATAWFHCMLAMIPLAILTLASLNALPDRS